jgi:alpha-tubulin suppressor-like RCC1 family protein
MPPRWKIAWLLFAMLLPALTSGAQAVTQVAAGGFHSLFIESDGSLWAMGRNNFGQLGDGSTNSGNYATNLPERIVTGDVTAIAAGGDHSLFLKSDGSLWAMGNNSNGQLGDGTFNNTNQPEQIMASNITAIAAGSFHSLFLKSDGSLWGMGYNYDGELGDGTNDTDGPYYGANRPQLIVATNVMAIAAGDNHSLFLKQDGSLWAMGQNLYGQLGDRMNNQTNLPERIIATNVMAIAAGYSFSLFLKNDGSLWAMGNNQYGELGDGTTDNGIYQTNQPEQIMASNVTAVVASRFYSLFRMSDGSLWAMGYNSTGQLGDGAYDNANRPQLIVSNNVTAIAGGWQHSLFLKSDGSLWAMGDNSYGQLGDGSTNNGNFNTNLPEQIVTGSALPPGYNRIISKLLNPNSVRLSFVGLVGTNYALDRTFRLSPASWVPQATNPAGPGGLLVLTNTPNNTTNNFWRIRSVP